MMTVNMTVEEARILLEDMQRGADLLYDRYIRIRRERREIWGTRHPLGRRYYSLLYREGKVLEMIDSLAYRMCDMRCRARWAERGL